MIKNTLTDDPPKQKKPENQPLLLMSWSIKTIDQPPRGRKIILAAGLTPSALTLTTALWSLYEGAQDDYEIWINLLSGILIIGIAMTCIFRKKTIFNYKIHSDHGEVESFHYTHRHTGFFLKSFVIFAILALMSVAFHTKSWLIFLLGPFVILMGAGGTLLSLDTFYAQT